MAIGMTEALKKAKKYPVPTQDDQYVRFPSIEIFCAYLKLHDFRFIRFQGDLALIGPNVNPVEEQPEQEGEQVTA